MSQQEGGTARAEVRNLIRRINEAWTSGRPEEVGPLLHEEVVFVFPGFAGRAVGRAACAGSYEDFCRQAKVHRFVAGEPEVDLWDSTAVATYTYDITYEMGGESFTEHGRDLFVFTQTPAGWQATWRHMLSG